jgi:hypothetical protein
MAAKEPAYDPETDAHHASALASAVASLNDVMIRAASTGLLIDMKVEDGRFLGTIAGAPIHSPPRIRAHLVRPIAPG